MKNNLVSYIIGLLIFGFFIGIPVWDKLSPIDNCDQTIAQNYGEQFRWCIGFSFSSNKEHSTSQRIYVMYPQVLSNLGLISLEQTDGHVPIISEFKYGAIAILFVFFTICLALWKKVFLKINNNDNSNISDSTNSNPAP